MSLVGSFRVLYLTFRAFGIFPYHGTTSKGFQLCRGIMLQARCTLVLVLVFRLVVMSLDLKYNFYSSSRRKMTVFRAGNTAWMHFIITLAYRNVIVFSRATCDWLNKMNKLYSAVEGDPRCVFTSNRFLICYSITFFSLTNILTLIGLRANDKFMDNWIAFADGFCFVALLMIQNAYLCQFLCYARLVALTFQRINQILGEQKLRPARGATLLRKLKKVRVQHLTVTDFFDHINSAFQLNLLFYVCWSFLSVVVISISPIIFEINDAITLMVWLTFHPLQDFPVIYLCESVYSESRKSINLIHDLLIQNDDQEIKEEAEIFSLQLQHRPTNFSVCGFFEIGYKLIYSVIGIVTMYIIALIQIQPTPIYIDNGTTTGIL